MLVGGSSSSPLIALSDGGKPCTMFCYVFYRLFTSGEEENKVNIGLSSSRQRFREEEEWLICKCYVQNPEDLFNSMLSSSSSSDSPSDELRLIFENLKFGNYSSCFKLAFKPSVQKWTLFHVHWATIRIFTDTPGNVEVMKVFWKYKCSLDKEKYRNQQMLRDISFLQTHKMDLEETVDKRNISLSSLDSELLQLQRENRNLKYVEGFGLGMFFFRIFVTHE